MGRIAILADIVADQIAAGEVVERPASVVKELVENALDSGATSIVVEVENGGKRSITVADNGCGMDRDDAVLALDRHATSKVRAAEDLVGVSTFGFRGEALPAIASISSFELETATDGDASPVATLVRVSGGRMTAVEEAARQRGTTVRVGRLFFNAPARRKFLRSQAAETRAIGQAMTVLALSRLDVSFFLQSDGRTLLDAPIVDTAIERIQQVWGKDLAETLIPVEHVVGPVSVRGFVQRPADAKPSGRRAQLYVNGRPFTDYFLVRAAEAGYRATIHPGNRPSILLDLSVPGEAVDVNVHPSKLEVKFRDKRFMEHAVAEAVKEALGGLPAAAVVTPSRQSYSPDQMGAAEAALAVDLFESVADEVAGSHATESTTSPPPPPGRPIQIFSTYMVMETPDGLSIIDQHSAHERVLYERAMAELSGGGAMAQRLLLPITLDLDTDELDAVDDFKELLSAIGFEVEPFGGRSIVLHAVPNPHPRFDARRCFEEIVADFARGRFGGWANRLERFAATYACRAAVKAGQRLDDREMRGLLDALFACDLPPHDVHGRPTIVQLPRHELERRFGRS